MQNSLAEKGSSSAVPCLYKDPADALKAVRDDYYYWTGKVTDNSFALCLAVIGANWAACQSVEKIINNTWAKASIITVLICLGGSLLLARRLGVMHKQQMDEAESDLDKWSKEFEKNLGSKNPWPFTKEIEHVSSVNREQKAWLPILGGLLFILGLFIK